MDQRPAAHGGQHETSRTLSSAARARLAAALRDERAGARAGPSGGPPGRDGPEPPRIPPEDGLELVRPLGSSSWLVREVRSGEQFVLRPCPEEAGPRRDLSRSAVRSLAVALAGREEPCVVAVRGLLGPAAAPAGLVEDFLPGGSLADRLSGGHRLEPADAASVLRDAATGLAALHALGRCHGELTARQILFRTPGRPATPGTREEQPTARAAGPGPAAVRAGTAAGSPAGDVRDLAVVGWAALTGRSPAEDAHRVSLSLLCPHAPPGLVLAVEAALDPDPSARPTAGELADRLATPHDPGSAGGSAPSARPARRPGLGRRAVLCGAVTLLLAAGGAVLLPLEDPAPSRATGPGLSAAPGPSSTVPPGRASPRATPPVPVADPRRALRKLVARRGEALRTGDARLLEEVYAPGAEAAAADRDTIARAVGTGDRVFDELVLEVADVRDAPAGSTAGSTGPGAVRLLADVRVDGYRGGPDGAPSVLPSGEGWLQTVVVTLVDGEQGWRLARVDPAAGTPSPPATGPARGDPRG